MSHYLGEMYKEEILKNYEKLSFSEQIKIQLFLEELVGKKETYISNANHIKYIANQLDLKPETVKKNTFYIENLIFLTYGDVYKRMHNERLAKNTKYKKHSFNYNILAQNNSRRYEWTIVFNILTENIKLKNEIEDILIDIIEKVMAQDFICYTLPELIKKYKQELVTAENKLSSYNIAIENIKYIQLDLYIDEKLYYYASIGEK